MGEKHQWERETLIGCLLFAPRQGIEPATFWCMDEAPTKPPGQGQEPAFLMGPQGTLMNVVHRLEFQKQDYHPLDTSQILQWERRTPNGTDERALSLLWAEFPEQTSHTETAHGHSQSDRRAPEGRAPACDQPLSFGDQKNPPGTV